MPEIDIPFTVRDTVYVAFLGFGDDDPVPTVAMLTVEKMIVTQRDSLDGVTLQVAFNTCEENGDKGPLRYAVDTHSGSDYPYSVHTKFPAAETAALAMFRDETGRDFAGTVQQR